MIPLGLCQCGCGGKTRISPNLNRARGWVAGQPLRFISGHNKPKPKLGPRTCTVPGCERVTNKRFRYCPTHDTRLRKYGSFDLPVRPEYEADPQTGCWNWIKTTNENGYGVKTINYRAHYAHRVYYQRAKGPIPDGMHLDHLCRNRRCVNPDHLEAVTPAVNAQRCATTRLTPEKVRAIRARHAMGEGQQSLAATFGIDSSQVCRVVNRKSWRNTA